MEMKAIKNSLLGEVCYEIDHPSGLKIFVIPKEGYKSTYAVFGTKYGSVDTCFRLSGEENFITVLNNVNRNNFPFKGFVIATA